MLAFVLIMSPQNGYGIFDIFFLRERTKNTGWQPKRKISVAVFFTVNRPINSLTRDCLLPDQPTYSFRALKSVVHPFCAPQSSSNGGF